MVQDAEEEDAIVRRFDEVGQILDPADPHACPLRIPTRRGGDILRIGVDPDVLDTWKSAYGHDLCLPVTDVACGSRELSVRSTTNRGTAGKSRRLRDTWMRSFHAVQTRFAPGQVVIHRLASLAAAETFNPETFDIVYIDGDHTFEAVLADLVARAPRQTLGVLAGDDYCEGEWWHGV